MLYDVTVAVTVAWTDALPGVLRSDEAGPRGGVVSHTAPCQQHRVSAAPGSAARSHTGTMGRPRDGEPQRVLHV